VLLLHLRLAVLVAMARCAGALRAMRAVHRLPLRTDVLPTIRPLMALPAGLDAGWLDANCPPREEAEQRLDVKVSKDETLWEENDFMAYVDDQREWRQVSDHPAVPQAETAAPIRWRMRLSLAIRHIVGTSP